MLAIHKFKEWYDQTFLTSFRHLISSNVNLEISGKKLIFYSNEYQKQINVILNAFFASLKKKNKKVNSFISFAYIVVTQKIIIIIRYLYSYTSTWKMCKWSRNVLNSKEENHVNSLFQKSFMNNFILNNASNT